MRDARRVSTTMSRHGFGAAQLGNLYRETSDQDAAVAVAAAWQSGVRYFDTAPHYGLGLSERRLGKALQGRPRDDFLVSTKVGRLLVDNPGGEGKQDDQGFAVMASTRREWDFSRDGIRRSVDASLTRLGLDRVDILYLHDPDDHGDQAHREGMPALIELRDEGMVAAVGVGMNQSQMPARFIREHDLDLVMLAGRYTLLDRTAQDDLLPLALERGVGIVAAGVYNSGLLSTPQPASDARFDYAPADVQRLTRAKELARICESHGATLPQAAAQFPLRHDAVLSVVIGARTAQQVNANAERLDAQLPSALWDDIDAAIEANPLEGPA
ncbi:aldo/keto reductase [Demequina sp.]|uniref:aldo/keto reductase n=1 Tax=Demequina sp. TaxID=2050685 RepID=UPI003A8B2B28